MVESFLETEPEVVTTAGHDIAGTAGSWQEWAAAAAVTFADTAGAAGNRPIGTALDRYAAEWQPAIGRLAGQVQALGDRLGTAAAVVWQAELTGERLLAATTAAAHRPASALRRPVNFL